MKIAILGSGGREHAIAYSVLNSKKTKEIYCIPGNAGTSQIAKNVSIDLNNFEKIYEYLNENEIDLVIVGPEEPLVNGIVDYLENHKIKVFGPNKLASQLEGSKIFTKKICEKYNIPTAAFGVFENQYDSLKYIDSAKHPIVIKADNLASGKGVYICKNKKESNIAVKEIFGGKFGNAKNILFEEYLVGEEMSYFIVTDGVTIKNFGTAQDHKRVGEKDTGKNTGGMGAYSPSRLINEKLEEKILKKIIKPTLKGISEIGTKYKGFLYAGLMIVNDEPYLIEYNVRMGDPECQTILPKLNTDIVDIVLSCINEKLKKIEIKWKNKKSICVVLCSNGYPEAYKKNLEIKDLKKLILNKNNYIFHAGTKNFGNKILSNGGRVLNFVSLSDDFYEARSKIHNNLELLNWKNGFYRKDIAFKVIKK